MIDNNIKNTIIADARHDNDRYCYEDLYYERKINLITEAFYMSFLEHEWMIIFEAESAHGIKSLCIGAGLGLFNTLKIVGLKRYDDVYSKIGK